MLVLLAKSRMHNIQNVFLISGPRLPIQSGNRQAREVSVQ